MANTKTASEPKGIFIRELMEARGLKNKDVAEAIGTSDVNVSRLLSGQRGLDLDWLHAFARALDVPIWELFQPPGRNGKVSGEAEVKALLRRIEGLPDEAVSHVWRLIDGYVSDAE
ncbi:helix-turn-helix domain-containing protein [Shinella sp. JR1-6]|uniref:helix-turn-helix domain-containing protein n=1 Tax=Shinella sp. JR1-6 TaxID=2527671 RepID=UPI00102D5E88|nr:helix-turn-helix domain-containing protein [Shinella sp. JR1-6]TAA54048.1 helix-turn-helix domain-containing protein [Shinella sp. JR1-6]